LVGTERYFALSPKRTGAAPTRPSIVRRLTLVAALATCVAACQTERQNIPDLTAEAASKLPPDKVPRIFRDPTNPYGYPYNIHETNGLSRNPDDCAKWGCIDVGHGF
jgi:hypothetical protein